MELVVIIIIRMLHNHKVTTASQSDVEESKMIVLNLIIKDNLSNITGIVIHVQYVTHLIVKLHCVIYCVTVVYFMRSLQAFTIPAYLVIVGGKIVRVYPLLLLQNI